MNRMGYRLRLPLAVLTALAFPPGVDAAQKTPAPAHVAPPTAANPGEPKKFGDWTVRCFEVKSPAPCDMFELLTQKQTGNRVMSMSIAYAPQSNRHVIQIVVPLGVSLPRGATLVAGSYTSPRLLYRRCNRTGCFIEGFIEDSAIAALGQANVQARMMVVSDDGRPFNIPFSLRGFSQAHDAMADLDRQKSGASTRDDANRRTP